MNFTTYPMPVNNYGDTKEVIELTGWQSGYAKYLQDNNLELDAAGNPIKKETSNV